MFFLYWQYFCAILMIEIVLSYLHGGVVKTYTTEISDVWKIVDRC